MNIRKMILGLVVAVATSAFGAWFDNPTVQATVQLGHANTGAQYINLSEEGVYLMVNTHRDNDNYPVQLYRTEDLVKASGTVSGLALGEAYGKDLFGTSSDGTGNGWKGGAISVARGLMIPGNGKAMGANFTSLEFPNCCWNPDVNAFAVTGLGTEGRDGLDFNPSGTRLFANQYAAGANSQIEVYSFVSKSEFALEGSYETPAVRVRNLSCYSIQGKDLVYFGEGAVATGSKSVYVFDPETHETTTLVSNSADITADVMNVKVSGTKTVEPLLQVALDDGTILIYTLAPDGRSLASASPTVVLPETTARLCGVEGTSVSQFRNFEVTDDGETAFLMPVGTAYPATDIPGLRVISSPSVNSDDFSITATGEGVSVRHLETRTIITLTAAATVTVTGSGEADVLLVGGGGGGGDQAWKDESDHSKGTYGGYSGGGGGGGVVYKRRMVLSAGQYDIVVGAGGAVAANGEDTTGFGLTAFGGGHGGQAQGWANATDGGCGGGAVSPSWIRGPGASKYDGSDPDCHGTVGGGSTGTSNAGGGGGAGEAGFAGNDTTNPGKGGDGFRCLISGEDVCYGGGGGGGGNGQSGLGGKGGGGAHGWDATPGTGGGGGGHALGGSGIVIVRFAKKTYPDVSTDRATGGRRHFRDGYCIHTFSAGGTFTVAHDILADVLLVGGGGGGGYNEGTSTPGGGGGAGGFVYRRNIVISAGSHPIVVGQGGATAVDGDTAAAAGGNTEAFDLVAFGGGAGANCLTWKPAGNGASGGGGTHNWKQYDWQLDFRTLAGFGRVLDAMPDNCGHSGAGSYTAVAAGGGGGAGGPGCVGAYPTDDGHNGVSGCGGVGLPCSITGEEVWYAGGGAGGRGANGISGVEGGQGGGGDPNQPGTDGLGGGGGGGAKGGSGVVIIRYAAEPAGEVIILR